MAAQLYHTPWSGTKEISFNSSDNTQKIKSAFKFFKQKVVSRRKNETLTIQATVVILREHSDRRI
jgi:hypothetical protein